MQIKTNDMMIDIIMSNHKEKKFEYEPPYQREGDVWTDKQKSLFIDSIMKNYPIPTIYLNKKNKGAEQIYEVIDGKQRLSTIISFVNNEFKLQFDENETGYTQFGGKRYCDLQSMYKNGTLNDIEKKYIDNFDSYSISFKVIQDASNEQIKDIFDRLNRGETLNAAEIIHGNYFSLPIYKAIVSIATDERIRSLNLETITGCPELNSKRKKNILFWANIFLSIHSIPLEEAKDETSFFTNGSTDNILTLFRKYKNHYENLTSKEKNDENIILQTIKQNIINSVNNFEIIFKNVVIPHNIARSSHLFTLFQYSYYLHIHNYSIPPNDNRPIKKLNEFFSLYSTNDSENSVSQYKKGMVSNSQSNRKRRFDSLKSFVN